MAILGAIVVVSSVVPEFEATHILQTSSDFVLSSDLVGVPKPLAANTVHQSSLERIFYHHPSPRFHVDRIAGGYCCHRCPDCFGAAGCPTGSGSCTTDPMP